MTSNSEFDARAADRLPEIIAAARDRLDLSDEDTKWVTGALWTYGNTPAIADDEQYKSYAKEFDGILVQAGAPLDGEQYATTGDVRSAVVGSPAAEVKGSADLNVSVQVEPSDSFISRIVSELRNGINVFGGSDHGTHGSTGLSMPEAVPGP